MTRPIALFASATIAACAAAPSSTPTAVSETGYSAPAANVSRIEVRLVDAPNPDVKEIVVSITGVDAHFAGGSWVSLSSLPVTVDLLQLQGGTFASLGIGQLPPGHVTQLRLSVSDAGPNYVTTMDGVRHPLTVPSGDESGIKLVGGFDVPPCALGNVTLDFDGKNSIFVHPIGRDGGVDWMLRPVVRLHSIQFASGCDDAGAPPLPLPPVPVVDSGAPAPTPPPAAGTPPADPCLQVNCPIGQYCQNGICIPQIG